MRLGCLVMMSAAAGAAGPLRWLHFPKAGQSLRTALVRAACGERVGNATFGAAGTAELRVRCCPDACARLACPDLDARTFFAHKPLAAGEAATKRVVAMFREPRARILSAYHDGRHAYGRAAKDLGTASPREFAAAAGLSGCATKMVLGYKCAESVDPALLDVDRAVARLRNFAFVGLTARWAESLALWHATLGGATLASELYDTHHGGRRHDVGVLGAYADPLDDALYDAAVAIYKERIRARNATAPVPPPPPPREPPPQPRRKRCFCLAAGKPCRRGAFTGRTAGAGKT